VLNGGGIYESVKAAVQFISNVSAHTKRLGTPPEQGLNFEEMTGELMYE
jgi:plasmid stabilization system protein ParE